MGEFEAADQEHLDHVTQAQLVAQSGVPTSAEQKPTPEIDGLS
jgi:hypothetical protein